MLHNFINPYKMKRADPPTNVIWNTTYEEKWAKSS